MATTTIFRYGMRRFTCHRTPLPSFGLWSTAGSVGRRCLSRTAACSGNTRLYSDKHEWVTVDGKIGKVGISQYAQEALGDIVYAQLPDVGTEYSQHDECGALESVKAASELYTPVSGKVVTKNTTLESSPGLINKSCYDKGWLFTIELKDANELKGLMDEGKYQEYIKAPAAE